MEARQTGDVKFFGSRVGLLCWVALVLDGFDLVVLGALIPHLTGSEQEWMSAAQATFISTIGMVGMTVGALFLGVATDKMGRRVLMIAAVFLFSLFTLLCGFAMDPWQLAAYRFVAGIGLGGCLPTAIALTTEFSQGAGQRHTGRVSTILMTGYNVGAMATALLGLWLLPYAGWRPLFWVAGIAGLFLSGVMIILLPESPTFLWIKNRGSEAQSLAKRYGFVFSSLSQEAPKKIPMTSFLKPPLLLLNGMLWVATFMGLLLIYSLNTWLPTLMVAADYGLEQGLSFLFLLNSGAIFGLLVMGVMGDIFGLNRVVVICYLAGGGMLALLSVHMPFVFLCGAIFFAGSFLFSAQVLIYAFTAASHSASVRASALGLAAGIGRLGAIIGPLVGGVLIAYELGHSFGFYVFSMASLLAAFAMFIAGQLAGSVKNLY